MEWKSSWRSVFRGMCAVLFFGCVAPANAEVTVGPPDPDMVKMFRIIEQNVPRVVIELTGEITSADARAVTDKLDELWSDRQFTFQEGAAVYAVLDSPGGSFAAGIDLARQFFDKGVTTFVPPGGSCMSACAVAFMAGRHVSMGGEGAVDRSRIVAMPAELGFHRPFLAEFGELKISPNVVTSLTAEEMGAIFSEQYAASFDAANALLQEMLEIDPVAWHPDLLVKMLTAQQGGPNGGFIRLETVADALIWNIDVANIPPPPMATDAEKFDLAFAFCFNVGPTLNSSVSGFWEGAASLEGTYQFNANGGHRGHEQTPTSVMIYVHHEGPMGCLVNFDGDRVSMAVGQGIPGPDDTVRHMSLALEGYHPDLRLSDIATAATAATAAAYRCMVFEGSLVLDDEDCSRESQAGADGEVIYIFTWPSGSRTVLQTKGVRVLLNGANTRSLDPPRPGLDVCHVSQETRRAFCYGRG